MELQNEQNSPRERALGGQAEQNLPSLSIQDSLGCQPSLCRLRWGQGAVEDAGGRGSGGRRERAQQLQQDPLIKQGNPGSVGQ